MGQQQQEAAVVHDPPHVDEASDADLQQVDANGERYAATEIRSGCAE